MFFIFIISTRFFTWGAEGSGQTMRCGRCGTVAPFKAKKGMRFLALFFVIPLIPLGGVKHLAECPNCRARYETAAS